MQHSPRQHFTVEIPTSRKAFWDWYDADRNKRFIYYLALFLWVCVVMQMFTILPLTATSAYRVAFYLPLSIFAILFFLSTHWLIQCLLNDYNVSHLARHHQQERTVTLDLSDPFNGQATSV